MSRSIFSFLIIYFLITPINSSTDKEQNTLRAQLSMQTSENIASRHSIGHISLPVQLNALTPDSESISHSKSISQSQKNNSTSSLSIVDIPTEMVVNRSTSQCKLSKVAELSANLLLEQAQIRWLLSLDGGGVSGIMQLQIIAEIEKITKKSVVELFDGIAGTSTGGIIACLLTMPNPKNPNMPLYSAQDLLDIFTARREEFFQSKWQSCHGLFKTRYKTTSLKNLLKSLLGNNQFSERLLPTVVVTHNLITNEERLISSNDSEDFFSWSVALATSAAPTYFKPQRIFPVGAHPSHRGYVLSGGATCMNNPTMAGIALMHGAYKVDPDNLNVLSLGSGTSGITRLNPSLQNGGIFSWGMNIASTCIAGQASSTNKLAELYCKDRYHRLNPIIDQENMKFDDISESNQDVLFAAAQQCIKENQTEINEIITLLTNSLDLKNNNKLGIPVSDDEAETPPNSDFDKKSNI